MPHSSTRTGTPPSEVTQSTISSAPRRWATSPRPSIGWRAPVEVSAWTMATAFGFAPAIAVSISSGVKTSPHSFSTFVTSTPMRPASSARRWPKKPAARTTSRSPGSRRLPSTDSIPAIPVPETARVRSFEVRKASRSKPRVSSRRRRSSGSRWPITGAARALITRGCTGLGPGPSSSRAGGFSSLNTSMGSLSAGAGRDYVTPVTPRDFRTPVPRGSPRCRLLPVRFSGLPREPSGPLWRPRNRSLTRELLRTK
jgi:hypothetical protein